MNLHLKNLLAFLKKNPLVMWSLILGILDSPLTFFSGVFLGQERYLIGVLLYLISTLLWIVSSILYWKLMLDR
jgi:hypothetical protein